MSYKREQFIENLDDILQDIKEIFILDRGGCIVELQGSGACVLFQKISRGMEVLV